MSCYCDGGHCDVYEEVIRKARKVYQCSECNEEISKGDTYTHISSLYEGRWGKARLCEFCTHDWKVLTDEGHCIVIGELEIAWREHWETSKPIASSGPHSYPGGNLWEKKDDTATRSERY